MTQPAGEHAGRFVGRLLALGEKRDGHQEAGRRATLAELRRGVGRSPGEAPGAYREVLALLGDGEAAPSFEDACFEVATLYSLYPENKGNVPSDAHTRRRDMGGSLHLLAATSERKKGAERRLMAMLDCDPDELRHHLRHAVSLLKADVTPIDWLQLLRDLRGWTRDDRSVQRRWARSFWGYNADDRRADTADTEIDSDGPVAAAKES
jgi:CRISPR system Cascade subunit CasB